ncbi:hypothetical protein IMCC12053_2329 [Celeribacter marinus]|uniref:Uncharacterized protein n=1 Tax=Celeribacter marinus TaxID=1397108 RepID=A0A0P0ADI8_9RHOB|nr:hypothetical protein IMCC12053_2329 [Celeribacter marinus]
MPVLGFCILRLNGGAAVGQGESDYLLIISRLPQDGKKSPLNSM